MFPQHIAIIMDGNGRWAQKRGLSRIDGHRAGVITAKEIIKYCCALKIPYLTLYAFSSENWERPRNEIMGLFEILQNYLKTDSFNLMNHGICLRTIGSLEKLPSALRKTLIQICEKTKKNDKLNLTIAISYGSRMEIVKATRKIVKDIANGIISINQISEQVFSQYLETNQLPDPDLFIRTSGEMRLSNFLLWQLSYSELYITSTLWPDFSKFDFDMALQNYASRNRRFGKSL
jgi:undecaprenyl diphosphate synthase